MESRRATLLELLAWDERVHFVIPKWQRQYVWEKAEVEQLWTDLRANCRNGGKHFCGVMLFRRMAELSMVGWEIVDGQQRMTTFFLLFIVVRDECERRGIECSDLNRVFTAENSEECRLVLRQDLNSDRDVMNVLLRRQSGILSKKIQDESLLIQAYQYLKTRLVEEVNDFDMRDFVIAAMQGVDLLILTVTPTDDTRRIFETLNSRGRRIDPFDLVANLIGFVGRENEQLNAQAQRVWYFVTQTFEKDDLDDFLAVFAKRNGYQTTRGTTLDEIDYEIHRANEQGKVEIWLREFERAAKFYQNILYPENGDDPIQELLEEIKALRVPKLNPFLLALLESFGETPASAPLINNVRSLIVRLLITYDRPAYKIEKFSSLACEAFYFEDITKAERLEKVIKLIDDNWISDEAFADRFATKGLYGPGAHLSRLRYYFEKIELLIAEEAGHPFEMRFGPKTTVEHIMPQTLNDVWINSLKTSDKVRREAQHQAMVDTVGNLTVLLVSDNSAVQNQSFATKKEFYLNPAKALKDLGLRSRKAVIGTCALNDYFRNISAWNFQAIATRGQYLAQLALKIWHKEPWNRDTA